MADATQSTTIHMAADTKGQINLRIPPEVFGDLLSGNRTAVLFKGKPHRGFKIRPYRMPTSTIKRTFDGWVIPIKHKFTDGAYKVSLPVDLIKLDSRLPKLPLTAHVTEHGIDTDALPDYVQSMVAVSADDLPTGDLIDDRAEEASMDAKGEADTKKKRGPGRPRKAAAEEAVTASVEADTKKKRGPGRPRKNPLPEAPAAIEQVAEADMTQPVADVQKKRGPGRPRKNPIPEAPAAVEQTAVSEAPPTVEAKKRGPGRPRKNPIPEAPAAVEAIAETGAAPVTAKKRGPGRPRKNPLPEAPAAAPVSETPPAAVVRRSPGRPAKTAPAAEPLTPPADQASAPSTPSAEPSAGMMTSEVQAAARVLLNAVLHEVKTMVVAAMPTARPETVVQDERVRKDPPTVNQDDVMRAVSEARRHGVSRMALRGFLLARPDQCPRDNVEAWASRFFDKRAVLDIHDVAEMAGITVAEVESQMENKPNTTPAPVVRGDGMLRWFPDEVHAWLGTTLDVDAELAKTAAPRNIHSGFLLLPEVALMMDMPDWMLKEILADHAERLPQTWALVDGEWTKHSLGDVADISELAIISGDLQRWMQARQAA